MTVAGRRRGCLSLEIFQSPLYSECTGFLILRWDIPVVLINSNNMNIYWYKTYSPAQLSVEQLLVKDNSHHISQLHVSAHFYGAIFSLSLKMAPQKWPETCSYEIWREISYNNNCSTASCVKLYFIYLYTHILRVSQFRWFEILPLSLNFPMLLFTWRGPVWCEKQLRAEVWVMLVQRWRPTDSTRRKFVYKLWNSLKTQEALGKTMHWESQYSKFLGWRIMNGE
jgi:hypothetical protein